MCTGLFPPRQGHIGRAQDRIRQNGNSAECLQGWDAHNAATIDVATQRARERIKWFVGQVFWCSAYPVWLQPAKSSRSPPYRIVSFRDAAIGTYQSLPTG